MTSAAEMAGPFDPEMGPVEAVLGLHAMKQRWAELTAREGLVRPSAAWFLVDHRATAGELSATFAAAVCLGLGTVTCDRLSELSEPGSYTEFFRSDPSLLPALLCFKDYPTNRETTHRYQWLGPPAASRTVPYTKVERANRAGVPAAYVGPPEALTIHIGLDDVVRAEKALDDLGSCRGFAGLVRRADAVDEFAVHTDSRLGWFCVRIADLMRARATGRLPVQAR